MAHDYTEVQTAFLEGTLEVFTELFTDRVKLYLLDTENTKVDTLYDETPEKVYKEPLEIVAKVDLVREQGERTPEDVQTTGTVRIPTKVLLDLGISFETREDLKTLEQSKIEYRGTTLQVRVAKPTTLVGDIYIFLSLSCTEVKE